MSIDLRQQAASSGSRVVLTGEWGDALLQGSREYYAEELLQRHWHKLYDCLLADVGVAGVPQTARWLLRSGVFPLLPDAVQRALRRVVRKLHGRGNTDALYWMSPSMQLTLEERQERFRPQPPCVRTFSQRDLMTLLHDAFTAQVLERLERLGAHVGVEMRHPMGDPRLVQFAFSTPERLRLRGNRTKFLHVQALRGILPQSILDRRTKAEFSIVFRRHLDEMREILTETLPAQRPDWVVKDGMARLYDVYLDKPQFGLPSWVLWGIHGCDTVYRQAFKAIGKDS
jgi:asparagine synthase (glutamine-hydrolysing)